MPRRNLHALILQLKDFSESSARISFFTREEGRLNGILKGYKSRRRQYSLAPFQRGLLSVSGSSSLATVTAFEAEHSYALTGNKLAAGFYLYELLQRGLVEHQAEAGIFDAVCTTLDAVHAGSHLAMVLRTFELYFLEQLGFGLDFFSDASSGVSLLDDRYYLLVPEVGFEAADQSVDQAFMGGTIRRIGQRDFASPEVLRAALMVTRVALRPIVGEQPLISRHLLKAEQTE